MKKENYQTFRSFWEIFLLLSVVIVFTINLSAQSRTEPPPGDESPRISTILRKTGSYCEKLKKAVFHFFCREKLTETVETQMNIAIGSSNSQLQHFFKGSPTQQEIERWSSRDVHTDEYRAQKIRKNSTKKKRVTAYVNDYQIIKQDDQIHEQRVAIEINGKAVEEKKKGATALLYSYKNALTPIYLFSKENQSKYLYTYLGKEKTMERNAYILGVSLNDREALPVTKDNQDINKLAIAWIDDQDFSIMKIKVMPGAIKGYSQMLGAKQNKMYDLKFTDLHVFGYLRQGIRYPTKTSIFLSYTQIPKSISKTSKGKSKKAHGSTVDTRVNTQITYEKYLFFDVAVDDPQFKDMEQNI